MSGFQLLSDANMMRVYGGDGAGAPPFTVDTLVLEGDSITSNDPSTPESTFYSYQYDTYRSDKAIEVRADGSRVVGYTPLHALNDNSNTLLGNVAEDLAYGPDLITYMIGTNDMGSSRTASQYRGDLTTLFGHYKAASPNVRIAWSAPIALRATDPISVYTNFMAQRADVLATCRDPAVWGLWADYYIPMGEHPDFLDAAQDGTNFSDQVHPSAAGQLKLYAVYKAAVDTILDATRASATTPYEAVWPVSETNLTTSTIITRQFILSGLQPNSTHDLSIVGAEIRRNGGAWVTSLPDCYNGDIIDLRETTSAANSTAVSYDLTIGSETRTITLTTVANVTPVVYVHGGEAAEPNPVQNKTFTNLIFAEDGLAVIALTSNNGSPTSVMLNGVPGNIIRRQQLNANTGFDIISVPVVAGTHSLVVSRASAASRQTLLYGYLKNADATPIQQAGALTGHQSAPHETPLLTVPANGIALGWLFEDGGASVTPATAIAPSVFIDEVQTAYQGGTNGLAMAKRSTTGSIGFDFAFGLFPRAGVVFKALGT